MKLTTTGILSIICLSMLVSCESPIDGNRFCDGWSYSYNKDHVAKCDDHDGLESRTDSDGNITCQGNIDDFPEEWRAEIEGKGVERTDQCQDNATCRNNICVVNCEDNKEPCHGKCVDLNNDENNCGKCGSVCDTNAIANSSSVICTNHVCLPTECSDGYAICEGKCINIEADSLNCGSCGNVCEETKSCIDKNCCTACDGKCVDLNKDENNCGKCGNNCEGTESCIDGSCCTACDGKCVDLNKDKNNCGKCGNNCDGLFCVEGNCTNVCEGIYTNCNNECIDLKTDVNHCGECSHACKTENVENSTDVECQAGTCNATQCKAGYAPEDGKCIEKPFVFTVEVLKPNTTVSFNVPKFRFYSGNIDTFKIIINKTRELTYLFSFEKTIAPEVLGSSLIYIEEYDEFNKDISIDCGSGKSTYNLACSFDKVGSYEIKVHGSIGRINLCAGEGYSSNYIIKQVKQWGSGQWHSLIGLFFNCKSLEIIATDIPDFNQVTNATFMFASSYDVKLPSNMWDNTSEELDFTGLFFNAKTIDSKIAKWNTSKVTNMRALFAYAEYDFNSIPSYTLPIEEWNVSKVTNMKSMFTSSALGTINLSKWDTSKVNDMSYMFQELQYYSEPLGLKNWNTSRVTNMSHMFEGARGFNQPIGNWDTKSVRDMSHMFKWTFEFNQPIDNWDTSSVTNMSHMFEASFEFNQPIGNWNTSNVTDMSYMFSEATHFNQNIGIWNTTNVRDMSYMFCGSFSGSFFNQPIGNWNTSNVTDMSYMFSSAYYFNQPIGNWDTSKVTDMSNMFAVASAFNQPIGNWNTSNVTDMSYMFSSASDFNQPIGNWDTSKVTDMSNMFSNEWNGTSFNQPIGNWDTSRVKNMAKMFHGATSFNQQLGNSSFSTWSLASVEDMSYMFYEAKAFNKPVYWKISNNLSNAAIINVFGFSYPCSKLTLKFGTYVSEIPKSFFGCGSG